jgi:hypothetical protein
MEEVQVLTRQFVQKKGQRLEDYLRQTKERVSEVHPGAPR